MNVLWFRRGLRIHDNPALLSALKKSEKFLPVFIFDTTFQSADFKPYHLNGYLLECLTDLSNSLKKVGAKLHIFEGNPLDIFRYLHSIHCIKKLCFVQDSEPIWHERDNSVKNMCLELDIDVDEQVAHTLWDPMDIIASNGGTPPLTYEMFVHVAMSIGDPPRPVPNPDWDGIEFLILEPFAKGTLKLFDKIPTLNEIGVNQIPEGNLQRTVKGGETEALKHLAFRLRAEEDAFKKGCFRPSQARPDILGPPLSLSAAIAIGALSVRLFYWKVHDCYNKVNKGCPAFTVRIVGQLIWREYFYTMSRTNHNYDKSVNNPICLAIPWDQNASHFDKWKNGLTGYPFIDAGIRQLNQEGWVHHFVRNAIAMFLTRGDLWQDWAVGAEYFANSLVDSDWSVNTGNWMWVSSSAFERLLDCSSCIDSVYYGKRLEPTGDYIRRYVPELAKFSFEYIHEPWTAPIEIQRDANCIIGIDYPERIVIHEQVSVRNQRWMKEFRNRFTQMPPHCQPSSENEVFIYFGLFDEAQGFNC